MMHSKLKLVVFFALFWVLAIDVAPMTPEVRSLDPLPIEESLRIRLVGNRPRQSADGKLLAYTVYDSSKRTLFDRTVFTSTGVSYVFIGSDVWITDVTSGESRNLTEGRGTSWSPVWSPDGNSLAFFSDRGGKAQVWIWKRSKDTLRAVSQAIVHQYSTLTHFQSWDALQWTPNGKYILAALFPENTSIQQVNDYINSTSTDAAKPLFPNSSVTVFRNSPNAREKSSVVPIRNNRQKFYFSDLGLIDTQTGEVRRLAKGVHATRYDLSPDGLHLAYLDAKGWRGNEGKLIYDLIVVTVATGISRTVAADLSQSILGMAMKWSPDSRSLAYIDNEDAEARCIILMREGGPKPTVVDVPRSSYGTDLGLPLWDSRTGDMYFIGGEKLRKVDVRNQGTATITTLPKSVIREVLVPRKRLGEFWTGDGKSIYVVARSEETKLDSVYKVHIASGSTEAVGTNGNEATSLALSKAALIDEDVIYRYEDALHAPDLWITSSRSGARQLTHANPVFERYKLGETRLIEWLSGDGIRRQGALLLPSDYQPGKRYPTVLWVYGSHKLSDDINSFGLASIWNNMHLLSTRGYAVLLPDSSVNMGTPMSDIAKNILPGVDKLVELGIADPERLGVMGHSYGGYSTLALIVQTARFKAAVCYAGISNLVSYYGSKIDDSGFSEAVSWSEAGQGSMGGSPWEYRERYVENSPVFYLDRVRTPLLLIHGELDPVPASQAAEVFTGLRRLGREVEYARYAGEGHSLNYYPNRVDYWTRIIGWLDDHLK